MLHSVRFPGKSRRYRHARSELLQAELKLAGVLKRSPRNDARYLWEASRRMTMSSRRVGRI